MTQNEREHGYNASDQIRQLSDIDKDVVRLLKSAGLAIKSLTSPPPTDSDAPPVDIEKQRSDFESESTTYFTLLSSIDVRLRRQINALEKAGITAAPSVSRESRNISNAPSPPAAAFNSPNSPNSRLTAGSKESVTGGGLGNLDIGWLNSRNDNVGKEMEAELWQKVDTFLDRFRNKQKPDDEDDDIVME